MTMTASTAQRQDSPMIQKRLTVRSNTPAFLGNAEQNGQWRTPPFKHLLREWWRVAWAEAHGFDVESDEMLRELRRTEGRLFGVAADEGDTRKSQVRIRLGRWDQGKMNEWLNQDPAVFHREVKEGRNIGAHLYLGFGPLNYNRGTYLGKKINGRFKPNAAIQAGEKNDLKLAYPSTEQVLLDRALALVSAFGAIGGRARNGWGSLELHPSPSGRGAGGEGLPLRDWQECLAHEWAHAIGQDEEGPLIWRTKEDFDDWSGLMKTLAEIKIGLRTQFGFGLNASAGDRQLYKFNKKKNKKEKSGIEHGAPQQRHWLSYPVTNHSVSSWDRVVKTAEAKRVGLGNRIPNTLRFKVRRADNGKLYGVIFHMPCKPPRQFSPDGRVLQEVWQRAHRLLTERTDLQRVDL